MVSPFSMLFGQNHTSPSPPGPYALKMAELSEITNYIMVSQSSTRNNVPDSLGLPLLVCTDTDVNAVANIERRLSQFEESLSQFWGSDGVQKDIDGSLGDKQHVLFGLRYVIPLPVHAGSCLCLASQRQV